MSALPRRFWFLTLLAAVAMALFCRLALWQYHRAHEREAILAAVRAAAAAPAARLDAARADTLPRFAHVLVQGRYDGTRQILSTEMPRPGGEAVGAEVLTPLTLRAGAILLVNRGWVPADAEGRTHVVIAPPAGTVRVRGYLTDLPRPGLHLGAGTGVRADDAWPHRLLYPRWPQLERFYGPRLLHRVLLLSPASAGGYDRAWRLRPEHGPQQNYGYMAQWLGFAATVFVVWLVLTLRSIRRGQKP